MKVLQTEQIQNFSVLKWSHQKRENISKKMPGTSYAAPLAANLAARLMQQYPDITNIQTIKALILNSSREIRFGPDFDNVHKRIRNAVCGLGVPDESICLHSDNHRATFIIEGSIRPEKMEVFELKLPEYLLEADRDMGLLKIHATLCFKFNPVSENQLAYCPVHFAFGFFKNIPVDDIQNGKLSETKLKQGWTEDYYFAKGILSNTQKVDFSISKPDLVTEENTVRIGVHSKLHKYLDGGRKTENTREHSYSLVISIEETTREEVRINNLYDELVAINELEAIGEIEIELEAET
ncbi:MAG: S8 family serine peptidase [Balneolaceae bacterium]|nr:S8 family serine peptidase [Balneolaceae bacterium]